MKKEESLFIKLRSVLLKDWDPILVGENPNLSDEYDEYIEQIIDLLNQGKRENAIFEFLKYQETQLGLYVPSEQREIAVNKIIKEFKTILLP
ncbi:hypothetical protein [Leptospira yasudae]|uniref:DUF1871 domain-containing protein n=1 Tax=Leptospira yasudae TaxID=2202201 RepID=A0ABX9LY36_9LEPT|nr:hypothetical protein [Leptospira yasudae]RHX77444.1 hypothetical protein DLM77_21145 [Leptospira yasudae]